jgi:REP element-mobilizing transposase RayT
METYHISEEVALYYFTFTVIDWLPVFVSEAPCKIVTESLNYCHREKSLRINAFVLMPTHLHLIAFDADFDQQRLQRTLGQFRRYVGHQLITYCKDHAAPAFYRTFSNTRRSDRQHQFWQQSRHPEAIWTHRFWRQKVAYLHDNPRRKGLVHGATGWRFSSAAYWLLDPPGTSEVLLSAVGW